MAGRLKAATAAAAPAAAKVLSAFSGSRGRRVDEFARKTATAVRLDELYRWGQGDLGARLQFARFLHEEISIRNAQLCKELQVLPFGLAETRGVSDVLGCFGSYVDVLAESPLPACEEDDDRFTQVLRNVLDDQVGIVRSLGSGVREVQETLGEDRYEDIRSEVDVILDRFFMKRIGLRFLLEHYIEAGKERMGVSGIIHSNVEVGRILRKSAKQARGRCRELYGKAPNIIIIGDGQESDIDGSGLGSSMLSADLSHSRQFTYVPMHLQFSCSVLLQNACFSVAEFHASRPQEEQSQPMPAVQAIFAHGEDEVAVKVSDEGGGIPRSKMHLSWSYFCEPRSRGAPPATPAAASAASSAGSLPLASSEGTWGWRHSAPLGDGNPVGAGLPLARLHARYYGGDLTLKSIDGFGTDAVLFLNRLGQNCENLPQGVRVSPSMRDSSADEDDSRFLRSLGDTTEAEAEFLMQRLAEFRQAKQSAET